MLELIIGVVVGAAAMYIFARNSPQHFLKVKAYDKVVAQKIKDAVSKVTG